MQSIFLKKTAFYFSTALIGALFFVIPAGVFAQNTPDCNFQAQLDQLKNIQENPLPDYQTDIKAELNIRKSILRNILECSIQEAEQKQSSLSQLKFTDNNLQSILQNLSSKLDEAINYYNFQEGRIGDLGIQGSKNLAKEIKEWRRSNYQPLDQEITDFIIWTSNQNLFDAAKTRLQEIQSAVQGLKFDEETNVAVNLENAQKDFQQAVEQNDLVQKSFQNFSLPDNSLPYIKSSLDYLAKTYQDFSDISEIILKP